MKAPFLPRAWPDSRINHLASPFGLPRFRPQQHEALRRARQAGLTTSIDTHWDPTGRWMEDLRRCLPYTDTLFVNEDESRMLSGAPDPAAAASILLEAGAGVVVCKLSHRGCAVFGPTVRFHCPAYPVPPVDTTGAGDCFVGGFLAARARGRTLHQAAVFANAVAALAVQKLGAVEGVRSYEETEAWISQWSAAPLTSPGRG